MRTFTKKEEKHAFIRIQKLKELTQLLARSAKNSDTTETIQKATPSLEPAYKRRGFELKEIKHSSEKIAKGFDDRI